MKLKNTLQLWIAISVFTAPLVLAADPASNSKHFNKIMVVIFENMSYAEIKDEPTFKKLVEYSGHTLDHNGRLTKLMTKSPEHDSAGNGYAFFSSYYNNHNGGILPTRPSQPNYIAMTSGSIQGVHDNENHDLDVDNLAMELNDANVSWKVYAEDLPDPNTRFPNSLETVFDTSSYLKPYILNANLSEQENDDAAHQHYLKYYKNISAENSKILSGNNCFISAGFPTVDGYQRKHEPFISYTNIQNNFDQCKKIVNGSHLMDDLNHMPAVSFYIPNQINDGHNGTLAERVVRANAFLSKMMGTNEKTGEPLPDAANAPFQKFMAAGGLLVITFDEPSVTGNPDKTIYTLFAGSMIKSGSYPNSSGENAPVCFPYMSEQTKFPNDENGEYLRFRCNHYNLLKLIEKNWDLRGLAPEHTSTGYKYAYTLDNGINGLWK